MDRQTLIDEVSEDLFTYVMQGSIPEGQVLSTIKPTGLDERFEDFDSLVDLHFLLRPDVVDFVEELPHRLRSVKTHTRNVQTINRGEVTGQIDWNGTLKARCSRAPKDRSIFVCDDRHETYDIDENIVLKRLLSVIYDTLDDSESYLRRQYDWVTDRWRQNLELVEQMRDVFERNVHVTRIREPEAYEPTERMLRNAASARNEIYREATRLLRRHRESRRGDTEAIRELLETTLIAPDDEETLFELYVLFRYVGAIEEYGDSETTVSTIETGRQEVARIEREEGADVVLYHDSAAGDRGLSFITEPIEKPEAELTRSERVQRRSRSVVNRYFTDSSVTERTGRPDVIVLEIRRGDQYEYLITEVKYTERAETIRQGVTETLEYLAFLRRNDRLVFDDESPFGDGWNGVLVVKDIEDRETAPPDEQETIRILQAGELEEFLPTVLEHAL